MEEMSTTGDSSNRYDIVIIGEGYTAQEQDKFRQHSQVTEREYGEFLKFLNTFVL